MYFQGDIHQLEVIPGPSIVTLRMANLAKKKMRNQLDQRQIEETLNHYINQMHGIVTQMMKKKTKNLKTMMTRRIVEKGEKINRGKERIKVLNEKKMNRVIVETEVGGNGAIGDHQLMKRKMRREKIEVIMKITKMVATHFQ